MEAKTHYPFICEKSRQIAGERSLQDLILESAKVKKVKDKPMEPDAQQVQASKEILEGFLQRNYDREKERKEQKALKQRANEEKQRQEIRDNARPKLSEGTRVILNQGSKKDIPTFEALYKAAKTIQTRKLEQ
jgi:hypothetical protein